MSNPTKRIDPAAVPGMFRTAGLEPVRWNFYSYVINKDHLCGCILTAIVLIQPDNRSVTHDDIIDVLFNSYNDMDVVSWIAKRTGFHLDYLAGVLDGWDGLDDDLRASTIYDQGFADGETAWNSCAQDFNESKGTE